MRHLRLYRANSTASFIVNNSDFIRLKPIWKRDFQIGFGQLYMAVPAESGRYILGSYI